MTPHAERSQVQTKTMQKVGKATTGCRKKRRMMSKLIMFTQKRSQEDENPACERQKHLRDTMLTQEIRVIASLNHHSSVVRPSNGFLGILVRRTPFRN